jgi:RNA:NAD 2'-phosphotransferase (TPT1/KptA family)
MSKAMSWLLRHGAVKEGIEISSDGWVSLRDMM